MNLAAPWHPALSPNNVAVVTGAASGIGFAAARRFIELGLRVALVDRAGEVLERAHAELVTGNALAGAPRAIAIAADVSRKVEVEALHARVIDELGQVAVLMNNAGIGKNPGLPWENSSEWKALFDVNLWGVVHGVETFVPGMLASGKPGLVINTGSKQGITSPPGNFAYNMSKAALKNYSESLAHALRVAGGGRVSAHLLIPGFTFTGMTGVREKPAGAWTPEQVVTFMLERIQAGDFYLLCPDNEVDRATDERRMRWAADDVILNRPALSRFHPDFAEEFSTFVRKKP